MEQLEHSIGKRSQSDKILAYMQNGGAITAALAVDLFNCYRLAARIADIRQRGYIVKTQYRSTPNGGRYAVYSMSEGDE